MHTKIALQTLYNEPDIVERLGVREDSLSSRWRIAKEGRQRMSRRALHTKVALRTLYSEPVIVERSNLREDVLSSRWRIEKEGNVGLNNIETDEGVALCTHARWQEFTGLAVGIAELMWLDLVTQKGKSMGARSSNTRAG